MPISQIITDDKNLQLIQNNVNNSLKPLESSPMNGGVVLNNVSLTTGQDNVVQHTLKHTPTLFLVGNLDSNSVVWMTASNSSTITLQCSASCKISLWIN